MINPGFELDPRLADGSVAVLDWTLSHVRLKDDARFPWLLLIPRRPEVVEITDLDEIDYQQLMLEVRLATRLLIDVTQPDKTNVATIGNLVPQLHVHVISRFRSDPGWPRPVWCLEAGSTYRPDELVALANRFAEVARAQAFEPPARESRHERL
jgi:diadenosine tetraphosphate (Ap4A) HIT family hydrolase